jgi:hypothetical protein
MKDGYLARRASPSGYWATFFLVFCMVFCGCQAKEPPLSPGVAAFKKEVKEAMARLSRALIEPVANEDVAAVNEILQKVEPEAVKVCRMCPFRIGVLDKNGDTLTIYPFKQDAIGNYSNYQLVIQTLNSKRMVQQRFFLQDGSQIYIVCGPIIQEGDVIGILALTLDAAEAKQRWGITEKEFMAIDFNS